MTTAARWNPDTESLAEHAGKYGYALGLRQWGTSRMEAERGVIGAIIDALGESYGSEECFRAVAGLVEGYRRAYKQFRFPSDALNPRNVATQLNPVVLGEIAARLAAPGERTIIDDLIAAMVDTETYDDPAMVPDPPETTP